MFSKLLNKGGLNDFGLRKKGGGVALYPKYHQIVMKIGMQLGF